MTGRWKWLLGACLALCLGAPVLAQSVEERPDVRVIVDVSGSMRSNDPNQLSASALELLASLLPDGTPAGVWTFGERVDAPLPPGAVDDAWRERAMALSPVLVEYQPFTDIEAAVREAAAPEAAGARHLVLLTDGVIDLPPARGAKPAVDQASRRALLDELAPGLAEQGTVVHAIAFSDEADLALVESLSRATGGLSALVETPESLLGAFLDIAERIFPADQVPLTEGRFDIEPGMEAFSALLFHDPGGEPLTLIGPDGSRYRADDHPPEMHWQVEPYFDLIRIPDPEPGEWRLEGEVADDSRVSVDSNLVLRTGELPATLYLGFPVPVEAWLERRGEPFGETLESLSMRVELLDMDDEVQASLHLQRQGERFAGELPGPVRAGGARLRIYAEAEGLTRQRLQAVNVLPAIEARHEPAAGQAVLSAVHPRLDRDNTELVGELGGETLDAEAVGPREWRMALPELENELEAGVSRPLLLTARISLDGETRELSLPRLLLHAEAETALDVVGGSDGPLQAERFHEDFTIGRSAGEDDRVADRFVAFVNSLPSRAMALWKEGRPGVERLVERHARDPRLWLGVSVLVLGLLILLWGVSRARRQRRVVHREEPHV